MDLKSISGVTCYVKDIAVTSKFYESLGFRPGNQQSDDVTFYVNWFWIKFKLQNSALQDAGTGMLLNIKVEDVDEFHKRVVALGYKPLCKPQNTAKDNREFSLQDPSGYNLVFFQKL